MANTIIEKSGGELTSNINSTPSPQKLFEAGNLNKKAGAFRDYQTPTRSSVSELYRLNHTNQTVEFVQAKKKEYLEKVKVEMGVWEAIEQLSTLIDDSDPDTDLPQIEHNLQTAEAIRRDGHPRWFILTGLIHDLGKILSLFGEPQWAVVGDTFPVGCSFSEKIVYPEFFAANPDSRNPLFQTRNGIYSEACGLDNVHFSWGHDEYLYQVMKAYLPEESLYMIRYHSCYVIHQQREYEQLMNEHDKKMFNWVRAFSPYDLYSKSAERPDLKTLRPYYEELVSEFLPAKLFW